MGKRTAKTSARSSTKSVGDNRRRAAQLMKRILIGFRAQLDEELRPKGVTTAQLQILKAVKRLPGRGGDMVLPVRMARRSMKFSLTDQDFSSPSFLRAGSMASWVQPVTSRRASWSAAKARVSSGVRFLGIQTSGG